MLGSVKGFRTAVEETVQRRSWDRLTTLIRWTTGDCFLLLVGDQSRLKVEQTKGIWLLCGYY